MKSRLVMYQTGTKENMQIKYGKEDTVFLNISRRPISDIQGMRFSTVIVEEDVDATKSEIVKLKHSL